MNVVRGLDISQSCPKRRSRTASLFLEPGVSKSIASSVVTLTSDWSVRAERKDAASMTSPDEQLCVLGGRVRRQGVGDRYPEERQDTIIFGAGDVVAADRVVERIHRYFAYIRGDFALRSEQYLVRRRPELIAQSNGF